MIERSEAPGPELEQTMIDWCAEGAEIALRHHRQTGDLKFKYAREAVTIADREIEKLLRQRIGAAFPADNIVGEEFGGEPASRMEGRTWQIDPIDGTLNFALGLPNYCLSLALMSGEQTLAACILQPSTGDTFTALLGQGARLNGLPLGCPSGRRLAESIISLHLKMDGLVMSEPALLHQVMSAPLKVRRCGAMALELAWVAAGFCDLLLASFKGEIHRWDVAGGLLMITEAGGVAQDFQGRPYCLGAPELMAGSDLVAGPLVDMFRP